jgi:hypothetical protein
MANKPKFIDKFWPVSTIVASRTGSYKKILAQRIDRNKYLIENTYGVKAEKVVDIFIKAYLASDKDYPAPILSVQNPQSQKDFDLYNQYILFLWEYYVKNPGKKAQYPKEPPNSDGGKKPPSQDPSSKTNSSTPGNLVLYEGIREEDLVAENIDERLLKLLGLSDVFDIDYGTYLSLLKERLVQISMGKGGFAREEEMLLQDEYRRVKGKVGRFKIKSKKINSDNIGVTGPIRVSKQQFFLASKVSVPDISGSIGSGENDGIRKIVEDIKNSVINIEKLLSSQSKLLQKNTERQRRNKENAARENTETGLEKFKKVTSLIKQVFAPVQNILDSIIRFIVFTFIGRQVTRFLDWLRDPKNKDKVHSLFRFIKDWWPTLLGAWFLFATPLGKFIRTIIGSIAKLTIRLAKFAIPKLVAWAAANPVTAGITALAVGTGIGAYASTQQVKGTRDENKKTDKTIVTPEETAKTGKGPGVNQLMLEQNQSRGFNMFRGGGVIPQRKSAPIRDIGFASGGSITGDTGVRVSGAGKDTQLIAAQPGEVVISKPAVDRFGANFFLGLNKAGGGTNIPRMNNNIQLAAGGGMVGGKTLEADYPQISPTRFKMPSMGNYSTSNSSGNYFKTFSDNRIGKSKTNSKNTPSKSNWKSSYRGNINNIISNRSEGNTSGNQFNGQKMQFFMPKFVDNSISLAKKDPNIAYNFQNKNINISSDIKTNKYIPEPPSNNMGKMITLPPIKSQNTGSGGGQTTVSSNRKVPEFTAYRNSAHRKNNIEIYGIAGVT